MGRLPHDARELRALRSMTGGDLDGLVESAAPVRPPAGARRAARLGGKRVPVVPTIETFYTATGVGGTGVARRVGPDGNFVWENSYADDLRDASIDANGFLYVAGDDFDMPNNVVKLDTDGNEVWRFAHGDDVYGLVADSDSSLYLAGRTSNDDGHHVRKLDSTGSVVWSYTGSDYAQCVAVDGSGNVYAGQRDGAAVKLDSTGSLVWSTSFSSDVRGIAVDGDGNVYTGDGHDLTKLDSDGNFVWEFTGHSGNIEAVRFHRDGFVCSAARDERIKRVDLDGNEIWSFHYAPARGFESINLDLDGFAYAGTDANDSIVVNAEGELLLEVAHDQDVEGVAVAPGSYVVAGFA